MWICYNERYVDYVLLWSTRLNNHLVFLPQVYKVLKKQYRMSWLPEKQLEWYHKELWCLEKGKKAERALPRLHDSLQRFAITFHHLREFRLKSDINVDHTMEKRNSIINGMYNEILRVSCYSLLTRDFLPYWISSDINSHYDRASVSVVNQINRAPNMKLYIYVYFTILTYDRSSTVIKLTRA